MADQNNSCQQPQGPQQPYQNQQDQNQQYSQQQNSSGSFDWFVNTPDYTQQFHPQDISDGKAMSILAYFGILFFLPLVVCPQSRFGRFHANQGLILLIFGFALNLLTGLFSLAFAWVPVLRVLWKILSALLNIPMFALFVIGVVNAANGRAKELPVIGKIRIIQ